MRIFITGGTGLIGRALCAALLADGHQVTVLSRSPERVKTLCGSAVQAMSSLQQYTPDQHFDAVINLAGEPIADKAWTAKQQQVLRDSRIALTQNLARAMQAAQHKPSVFLSGSAIGFYGDAGDTPIDEGSPASSQDFSSRLCVDWEAAALTAQDFGVRVCLLRTGLVLSPSDGMLAKLRLPARLGLAAIIGTGKQWMSWIHLQDYVAMVQYLLQSPQAQGAFNMTAPQPVRHADFMRAFARSLHRPCFLRVPSGVMRLLLGERAELLLGGQKVLPQRLQALGYVFAYPDLEQALLHV